MHHRLVVNGAPHEVDVPPGTTLLGVLRDDLGLTGTRFGCGQGSCGACYVLADGKPIPSCQVPVEEVAAREIVTVEGLAEGGTLHPVQQAFIDEDAMQCGYCIPGMIMSAAALLKHSPQPTDDEIREALAPHLCRCGVYLRAVRAVRRTAQ
jgi:aerobic-type carbon monoxide dehydrogenase small subunit (CoxS/CutS family)